MNYVVPVAGTWGEVSDGDWWRPDSVWAANLRNAGLALLDDVEPFEWSTALAVRDADPTWRTSGLSAKWYVELKCFKLGIPTTLVALACHSHGGNVGAHALAAGLKVGAFVTAGTPVRPEMDAVYAAAAANAGRWTHIYTEETDEPWQLLGSLPYPPGAPFTRAMAHANQNIEYRPPTSHRGLVFGPRWNEENYWRLLRLGP